MMSIPKLPAYGRHPWVAFATLAVTGALGACGDPEAAKAAKQIEECKLAMVRAGEPYKDEKTRNSKEAIARTICMNKFK